MSDSLKYKFSGHQSFHLRVAWLPKLVSSLAAGENPLVDLDQGIVSLGLGKNMLESLRCWASSCQIVEQNNGVWEISPFGSKLFGEDGVDPFFEDTTTAWVLHWLLATNKKQPLWAWDCLFSLWPSNEFTTSAVLKAFAEKAAEEPRPPSQATLRQHWEVFLHSYLSPGGTKVEDVLDSAFSILHLLRVAGESMNSDGKRERIFAFSTGPKETISQELFSFCMHNWWNENYPNEGTVPVSQVVGGYRSPGRILKMQASEIVRRIEELSGRKSAPWLMDESANQRQVRRLKTSDGVAELARAYKAPRFLKDN